MMAPKKKITLSFSGCGFLGIYHVGVASCFRQFEEYFDIEHLAGASAGAIAAACYLCKCCLGQCTADVMKLATSARASPVGPLSPRFNIVKILSAGLRKCLPEDAHLICSGRLTVSLTRCSDGTNRMVSTFDSKEELIQVLMCSAFVPLYSGLLPPYYKDGRYWDGGITNNLPTFDSSTVTVSPFSGESDICPSDNAAFSFTELNFSNQSFRVNATNASRVARALFPPHPDILKEVCEEGYVDALRYVKKTFLYCRIPEALIFSEPTSPGLSPTEEKEVEEIGESVSVNQTVEKRPSRRGTLDSVTLLLEKYSSNTTKVLPSNVYDALHEASMSVPHPVMRVLSYAALPWILPLEFMYSTCVRLIELTPKPRNMELQYYIEVFSSIAQRVAAGLLRRHGGEAWLQCNCTFESMEITNKRCVVHGKAVISQSHSLTFAFAIVEESSSVSGPSLSPLPTANTALPFNFRLPAVTVAAVDSPTDVVSSVVNTMSHDEVVAETTVLTAAIRCVDGQEDMLAFEESCDIVERFEREIADYFKEQIERHTTGRASILDVQR